MKKLIFLLAFLLPAAASFSQRTGSFRGHVYYVHPYRVENSGYSSNSDNKKLDCDKLIDIPYYPFQLSDGDYLVYYRKPSMRYNYKTKEHYYLPEDTTRVALTFSVKNGQYEGAASWYTYGLGKTYQQGRYSKGLKSGRWEFLYLSNYGKEKLYRQYIFNFDKGLFEGLFEQYDAKQKLTESRYYHRNFLNGLCTRYDKKGRKLSEYHYTNDTLNGPYFTHEERSYRYGYYDAYRYSYFSSAYLEKGTYAMGKNISSTEVYHKNRLVKRYTYLMPGTTNSKDSGSEYSSLEYRAHASYIKSADTLVRVEIFSANGVRLNNFIVYHAYYRQFDANSYYSNGRPERTVQLQRRDPQYGNIYLVKEYTHKGGLSLELLYSLKDYKLTCLKEVSTGRNRQETKYAPAYYEIFNPAAELVLTDSLRREKRGKLSRVYCDYYHRPSGITVARNIRYDKGLASTVRDFDITKDAGLWLIKNFEFVGPERKLALVDTAYLPDDTSTQLKGTDCDKKFLEEEQYHIITGDKTRLPDRQKGYILWRGQPYTGHIRCHFKGHKSRIRVEHRYLKNWSGKPERIDITMHKLWAPGYTSGYQKRRVEKHYTGSVFYLNTTGGKYSARQVIRNKKYDDLYEAEFVNGVKEGTEFKRAYETAYSAVVKGAEIKERAFFINGKRQGIACSEGSSGTRHIINFQDGSFYGNYYRTDAYGLPELTARFYNDTLDGPYKVFSGTLLKESAGFVKGVLHGSYQLNNIKVISATQETEGSVQLKPLIRAEFSNGYLLSGSYYFENGMIKADVQYDKDSVKPLLFEKVNGKNQTYTCLTEYSAGRRNYEGPAYYESESSGARNLISYSKNGITHNLNLLAFYNNLPAYYKYYYKNGVQSQEGAVRAEKKTGWWKYWNENGVLMKEIEYVEGYIINPEKHADTIRYKGRIKAYHPTGAKMMEGYVTDESFSYECVQDDEISFEDVYYSYFYDRDGNSILKNYSGMVYDYHINGNKRSEGSITLNVKTGLWKWYDPEGHLEAIGSYDGQGQKTGTWLEGDLGGVNFIDNQCFDVDAARFRQQLLNLGKLNFEEIIYENGHIIKTTRYKSIKEDN